jgi:hypothetical protein
MASFFSTRAWRGGDAVSLAASIPRPLIHLVDIFVIRQEFLPGDQPDNRVSAEATGPRWRVERASANKATVSPVATLAADSGTRILAFDSPLGPIKFPGKLDQLYQTKETVSSRRNLIWLRKQSRQKPSN